MMQRDADRKIANGLERAFRHTDFRLAHFKALRIDCFGDVVVGDGTKQAAIHASFLRNLHSQASSSQPYLSGVVPSNSPKNISCILSVTGPALPAPIWRPSRSEEHTSELQTQLRTSYAVFCLKK